jgi:hypothetical protein
MDRIPPFSAQQLTAICQALGDTDSGLTGSQIGQLLANSGISDPNPEMTKWKRLFNAFAEWRNAKQLGNCVLMFISRAMNPTLYTTRRDLFASRRDELNVILAFSGMYLGEDGKIRRSTKAENLTEAMKRASRLHDALSNRKVHEDVPTFCKVNCWTRTTFTPSSKL